MSDTEDGNADFVEHEDEGVWDPNPTHGVNTEDEKLAVFQDEEPVDP